VLQRCLAHRDQQRTANPHVIVTEGTRPGEGRPQPPISATFSTAAGARPA
jgi:hypothetical protein